MRSDRYTKLVLTVIAVGLWAIASPRLEAPAVMAASGQPEAVVEEVATENPQTQAGHDFIPTYAGPLRWRIGYAMESNPDWSILNECHTSISLLSAAPTSIEVEVEFYGQGGTSEGSALETLPPGESLVIRTHNPAATTEWSGPFYENTRVSTGNFSRGFALVFADDPRVLASAFLSCRKDDESAEVAISIANIPAFPVGATAQYFMAGMPMNWSPPMAEPEVPE